MKSKFKKLLGLMLIASTAKAAGNQNVDSTQTSPLSLLDNNGNKTMIKEKPNLLQKYIVKFGSDNSYLIAGHTSHRSHSSHRSSSGSYYTPSRTYNSSSSSSSTSTSSSSGTKKSSKKSTNSSSSNSTKNSFKSSTSSSNTSATNSSIYNLGDRTIKSGNSGTDVKVLAALLVKYGYMSESDIETDTQGYTICNTAMITGIKRFQKDAGLKVNGQANTSTISALKNWGNKNN